MKEISEEKKISENLKKSCSFYEVLWSRYDKATGSLMGDGYLDKKYLTLKDAVCAISHKTKEGILLKTTYTIVGWKKEKNAFVSCCVWNEEKKILEAI